MRHHIAASSFLLLISLLLTACAETLIDTPYIMRGEQGKAVFDAIPEPLRSSDIPILYVTDRAVDRDTPTGPDYGYKRSRTIEYGVATVSIADNVDWETLAADSTTGAKRSHTYTPRLKSIERLGSVQSLITHLIPENGTLLYSPDTIEKLRVEQKALGDVLSEKLKLSDRKEVFIFVHGYNNHFDDAVLRLAQAWHFTGRRGVPIVYTWPAGSGGLKGYAYDRESSEFTQVHFKRLLVFLALHPEVERVHIISHSRGTDVAFSAVRELHDEIRGALHATPIAIRAATLDGQTIRGGEDSSFRPINTADALKLHTLIFAAPDLDLDVFVQRFFGDNVLTAAKRVVVYFSAEDEALSISNWLFRSRRRVGELHIDDFPEASRDLFAKLNTLQLINCKVSGYTSHSYILQHPAALSDLIRLVGDDAAPGTESRPLSQPFKGIWELDNNYLKPDEK